ncbi:hypothetical protein RB195_024322 [Necator americanus]
MQIAPTLYDIPPLSQKINQMLKALDNPILPIAPDEDVTDEESHMLEMVYEGRMTDLRNLLHTNILELQQETAKKTLPVLAPRKKFVFVSAETISTYKFVCVARSADDFSQEKRLRRRLHRQLKGDREK